MNESGILKTYEEDEMPREKFLSRGCKALSNQEILAILISTGTGRRSALDLAGELLLRSENNIGEMARWTVSDYMKTDGIGPVKALNIMAAFELSARKQHSARSTKPQIGSSKDAYLHMRYRLEDLNYEEFWIVTLNRKNAVIREHRISEGGITATLVDQRKIFRFAIDDRSTGIILFHNHPSGNTLPSDADNLLTRKLQDAGKLLDINVLDHLIISSDGYYSYADEGRM